MYEHVKTFTPFITFILGLLSTPFIESQKEKVKSKKFHRNFMLELEDELSDLPRRLKIMANTLQNLKNLKAENPSAGGPLRYVPRNTTFFFLQPAIDSSFELFDKEQRYAIKSLIIQINAIDEYLEDLKETKLSEETIDELIILNKRYLFTGTCMLNTIRIISKNQKANFEKNDEKIINSIFEELEIKLPFEDIKIKKTMKFKQIFD